MVLLDEVWLRRGQLWMGPVAAPPPLSRDTSTLPRRSFLLIGSNVCTFIGRTIATRYASPCEGVNSRLMVPISASPLAAFVALCYWRGRSATARPSRVH